MVLLVGAAITKPRSRSPQANKWFHYWDQDLSEECVMSNKWFPTKKEIKKWIDQKLHEFVAQENRNLCMLKEEWLNRYLYTDEHEIFLYSFMCKLHNGCLNWRTIKVHGSWTILLCGICNWSGTQKLQKTRSRGFPITGSIALWADSSLSSRSIHLSVIAKLNDDFSKD